MDMDCKGTADLTARILSGNGSAQDADQLQNHVASCAGCSDVERRLRRTWDLLGQLAPVTSTSPVPALPRTGFLDRKSVV